MELINWDNELERLRESCQDRPPLYFCEKCNVGIPKGADYWETDDHFYLCEECFDEWQYEQKVECCKEAEED